MIRVIFLLVTLAAAAISAETCLADTKPDKPNTDNPEPQMIDAPTHSLVVDENGFHLSRWTIGLGTVHDVKTGWGWTGRLDYRLNNRWGLFANELNRTTSGGLTIRLGSIRGSY